MSPDALRGWVYTLRRCSRPFNIAYMKHPIHMKHSVLSKTSLRAVRRETRHGRNGASACSYRLGLQLELQAEAASPLLELSACGLTRYT